MINDQTIKGAVIIPLVSSFVSAVLAALLLAVVLALAGRYMAFIDREIIFYAALLALVGTMARDWHTTRRPPGQPQPEQKISAPVEDQSQPQEQEHKIILTEKNKNSAQTRIINLPEWAYKNIGQVARVTLRGQSLAESYWTGKQGLFSRSQFSELRAALLAAGVITWKNPEAHAQGIALTERGREVFQQLTGDGGRVYGLEAHPPTPAPPRPKARANGRGVRARACVRGGGGRIIKSWNGRAMVRNGQN